VGSRGVRLPHPIAAERPSRRLLHVIVCMTDASADSPPRVPLTLRAIRPRFDVACLARRIRRVSAFALTDLDLTAAAADVLPAAARPVGDPLRRLPMTARATPTGRRGRGRPVIPRCLALIQTSASDPRSPTGRRLPDGRWAPGWVGSRLEPGNVTWPSTYRGMRGPMHRPNPHGRLDLTSRRTHNRCVAPRRLRIGGDFCCRWEGRSNAARVNGDRLPERSPDGA